MVICAFGFIWAMTASRTRIAYSIRTSSFTSSNFFGAPWRRAVTRIRW